MKNYALNNMHFFVDPLGVLYYFRMFRLPCFRTHKGGQNHEKKTHLGTPFFELSPSICERAIPIQKSGPQRGPFRVLAGPNGPEQRARTLGRRLLSVRDAFFSGECDCVVPEPSMKTRTCRICDALLGQQRVPFPIRLSSRK